MKTYLASFPKCVGLLWLACGVWLNIPAVFGANSTPYYLDVNGTDPGFGTPSGTVNMSDSSWTTSAAGTTAPVALTATDQLTFGAVATDLTNAAFTVNLNEGEDWEGLAVNASNVVITLTGTANYHVDSASTWFITNSSIVNIDDARQSFDSAATVKGVNWNNENVTFLGGGTFNFLTPLGCNSTASNTENMVGIGGTLGTINFQMTSMVGPSTWTGGFSLVNGYLNFASQGSTNQFCGFGAGKFFQLRGGILDNTMGAPGIVSLGSGAAALVSNFTFVGSSSLTFGQNNAYLSNSIVITNLGSTLGFGPVLAGPAGVGLTATGPGILSIGGASTYTGPTIIESGGLALTGSSAVNFSNTSAITFQTNSVFDLSGLSGQVVNPNTLSLSNTTLIFSIPLDTSTNLVIGNLVPDGTNNIISIASIPVVTRYPMVFSLINYSNTLSVTNFSLAPLPPSGSIPYAGYLNVNNAHLVQLVLTNGPVPARDLVWTGTDPSNPTYWDVTTSFNWSTNILDPTTYFNQADFVVFNDSSASSPYPGQVSLQTTVEPSAMTVSNNVVSYVFSGGGSLADPYTGPLEVIKQGSGTMIMDNGTVNTYTGGTIISGGTLQIGNNDGNGSLANGAVIDNSVLVFNTTGASFANGISGSGSILQEGQGTLTLSGAISISGPITATSGTLQLSGANSGFTGTVTVGSNTLLQAGNALAFGAGNIVVQKGGVLDLDGFGVGAAPVVAQGQGSIPNGGNQGAIDNSGTAPSGNLGVEFLTLMGDTTLSASSGRWDIQSPSGDAGAVGGSAASSTAALSTGGNPYNLTIIGGQEIGIVSAWVDPALANIYVTGGTLDYEGNTSGLGNPSDTLTIDSGATLELTSAANPLDKMIIATNSATISTGGGSNAISGPVILTNAGSVCAFDVAQNSTLNLLGSLSGQATLQSIGLGTLILNGGNPFSGNLDLLSGTLLIDGDNSGMTNYALVNSSTSFGVDGIFGGAVTNSGGVIYGTGTNLGYVDCAGTIYPGSSSTAGTFTVGTTSARSGFNLDSGGNAVFTLSDSTTPGNGVNPLIVVNGNLTLSSGSTITINPIDLLSTGTYVLFTYSGTLSVPGGLGGINVPSSATGYNFTLSTSIPGEVTITATGGPNAPTWNGGAGPSDTTWMNAANWNGVGVSAGSTLYFTGSQSLNNTNNFPVDTAFGNIIFASGAPSFSLFGNNIAMNGGTLINDSSSPQFVNLGLDFNSTFALNGGSSPSAPLVIGGGINNSGNAIDTYLNGYGILSNSLANTGGGATNVLVMTNTTGSWTLLDNPTSEPITLPWGMNINAGTFTFGSSSSYPNLNLTAPTADVNGSDTFVGDVAGATGTLNIAGGTLTLAARIDLGEIAGSTGVLNVTGGTLNITSLQTANENGIGIVNVSGGLLTNSGQIYNATRTNATITITGGSVVCAAQVDVSRCINNNVAGIVNLNGGTLTCSRVTTASSAASATATGDTATFNFNGGTLVANDSSTTFFEGNTSAPTCRITAIVKSGGAYINDGGFAVSVLEPLQHDPTLGATADGGLTKLGSGTVTLGNSTNSYNGTTTVSAGTLSVPSGNAINTASPVVVSPGATLTLAGAVGSVTDGGTVSGTGTIHGTLANNGNVEPGSATSVGTLTVSGNIIDPSGSVTTIILDRGAAPSNSVLVSSSGSITFGGTLALSSIGAALQAGDSFKIFNASSYSGAFGSITPASPGANLIWNTNNLATTGSLSVVANPPRSSTIDSVTFSAGTIQIGGHGGAANGTFHVYASPTLVPFTLTPTPSWTLVGNGSYDSSGNFSVSITGQSGITEFYVISSP